MSEKKNCWEVMNCQRQPGGEKAICLGLCLTAVEKHFDEINGGVNAGRFCWMVPQPPQ